ncbi:MAG: hypothetical protein IJN59_04155 [Oscillospiraceae bacterium]|nr:hypothetical protein [Oscillospiraceae bacterium]
MAVTNFIQTIWSKKILDALEMKCKLVDNCLRDYEGDCKYAHTVKILGVGEPTIGDYTGADISIEAMSDVGQELNIDQAKYFAFYVDDVDKAQSVPGLAEEYQRKSVHALAVARDTYVATLIQNATNKTTITMTAEGFKEGVDEAIVTLRERNFDEEGVIEITPAGYNLFKNHLITLSTDNPEYIKKGIVGMYDGFQVVMSNNLKTPGCVRGKKAIAFAGQLDKVEACRAEKRFADIVKGLDVYGAKIIDNDRIQVLVEG